LLLSRDDGRKKVVSVAAPASLEILGNRDTRRVNVASPSILIFLAGLELTDHLRLRGDGGGGGAPPPAQTVTLGKVDDGLSVRR
jgi:hypothetical protein